MRNEQAFLAYSAEKLRQYTDRIFVCLDQLTPDQVWARGTENENAVGNLVLHLAGNVRQWIGSGVAGRENLRDRDSEFAARGGSDPHALRELLRTTVDDATAVIEKLTPERLAETIRVQAYDVTVLQAVYHVVEHFSQHTGQIIFATKLFTGGDLGFYRHLSKLKHTEQTP
jgi:uncharacterized damage-inducible protein DinB